MTTVMKKKTHCKKPKLNHEPVRAMVEPQRKIYEDARHIAATLQRVKNVPPKESSIPLSKIPEAPNDVHFHPLVPYPISPPTKEEVDALEALLSSVSPPMDDGIVPLKTDQATRRIHQYPVRTRSHQYRQPRKLFARFIRPLNYIVGYLLKVGITSNVPKNCVRIGCQQPNPLTSAK